jgi:hypothetical protein
VQGAGNPQATTMNEELRELDFQRGALRTVCMPENVALAIANHNFSDGHEKSISQ